MKATRLFALLGLWTMIAPAWSQFVIPDWRFRDWLEQIVPAAVNGDTLITDHPDVLALTGMTVGTSCTNCTPPNPQSIAGIEYFVNLEYLNISHCAIGQVQSLPNKIRELHMDFIPHLIHVDHWPDSARYISAKHDYYWDGPSMLQPIPPLPPYLEYLDLYANLLDTLRDIPPTLRELKMDRNRLDYFPALPNELLHLNIRGNLVPSIPSLPDSLRFLDVGGLNPFPSLPPFPPLLEQFHCTYINSLQEFPPFPSTLQLINTTGTNTACYPYVPASVTTWDVSTGLACIPNLPPFLSSGNAATKPICTIINSSCPTMSGATGTLFLDDNGDGLWDSSEPPLSAGWVVEAGGGNMAGVNATGHYFLPLDAGDHMVTGGGIPWMTQTTPVHLVSITQPLQVDSLNHIGFQITPGVVDLDVQLYAVGAPPRPGFTHELRAVVRNVGTQLTSGTVSLEHDPTDLWVSATMAPNTQQGTTTTWETGMLAPGVAFEVTITLTTPAGVPLGAVLAHSAQVACNDTEVLLANNAILHEQIVVASHDPNDKNAWPATLSPQEVQEGTRVTYTIRFQNTGTFLAERVVITDTLPDGLQWNSVEMLDATHPHTWFLNNGVLYFIFAGINLPDSQSDEPGSQGQVRFTVLPAQDLLPGATVLNTANIFFDFNPPVITEPSELNVVSTVRLDARAWLGGAYDVQATLMRDDLRAQALIPLMEPYTSLGYVHRGGGGGETVAPATLAIADSTAIVDWVVLELRAAAQPATVLYSRAALLRRDGRVTGKDGQSPVTFPAPDGSYHVAIRHRNHLGAMTAMPVTLSGMATTIDLTAVSTATWGTAARDQLGASMVLWPGDVNFNGEVKYTGAANDRDPVLVAIGSVVSTQVVNAYHKGDVNMDGLVKYTGNNNDRELILQTIGGTMSTVARMQQLP